MAGRGRDRHGGILRDHQLPSLKTWTHRRGASFGRRQVRVPGIELHLSQIGSAADQRGLSFDRSAGTHQRVVCDRQNRRCKDVSSVPARIRHASCGLAPSAVESSANTVTDARTELLHGSFGKAREGNDDVDGCTGAIALPPTTREGHLIHAHNWDWRDECADSSIVLKIVPEAGSWIAW